MTATDVDDETLTYRLSGPDAPSFEINDATGQITVGPRVVFDPALQSEYTVTVEARDRDFGAEVDVTITVVERVQPRTTGGGGGGGGGPPPVPIPSDADFDWNVTRDIESLDPDNELPTGIWSDGGTLWVIEATDGLGRGPRLRLRLGDPDRATAPAAGRGAEAPLSSNLGNRCGTGRIATRHWHLVRRRDRLGGRQRRRTCALRLPP